MAATGSRQVGGSVISRAAIARALPNAPSPKAAKLPTVHLPYLTGQASQHALGANRFVSGSAQTILRHGMPIAGASHVAKGAGGHPAANKAAPTTTAPKIGGTVTEVGGVITQVNPGGSAPAVVGGTTSTGSGYFANPLSGDLAGRFGLTWVTIAEALALIIAGYLAWKHFHRKGRR